MFSLQEDDIDRVQRLACVSIHDPAVASREVSELTRHRLPRTAQAWPWTTQASASEKVPPVKLTQARPKDGSD